MALEDLNYSGFMFARVVNNIDPKNEGRVQVLPKRLLMNNEYDKSINEDDYRENKKDKLKPWIELDQQNLTKLKENLLIDPQHLIKKHEDEAKVSQYIWVRPLFFLEQSNKYQVGGMWRIPKLNQHILIMFIDEDPQKGYYLPFTPTINGDTYSLVNTSLDIQKYIPANTRGRKEKVSEKVVHNHVLSMNDNGTRIEVDNNYETNSVNTILDKFTLDKPPKKRDYVFRRMQNWLDPDTTLNEKIWEGIYYETEDIYIRPNPKLQANKKTVYNHFTIDSTRKQPKYQDNIKLETGHLSYIEMNDHVMMSGGTQYYNTLSGMNYGGCYFKFDNNYFPGEDYDQITISTRDENILFMTNTVKGGTIENHIKLESKHGFSPSTYILINKDIIGQAVDHIKAETHTHNYTWINSDTPGGDYIEMKTPKGTKVIIDNRPGEEILSIDSAGNKIDLINGDIFIVCQNLNAQVANNTVINTGNNTTIQSGNHIDILASTITIAASGHLCLSGNPITLN